VGQSSSLAYPWSKTKRYEKSAKRRFFVVKTKINK
jgi:hypothetical protein